MFVKLVRSLKRYREQEKFEVWLFKIARNRIVDHWRKNRPIPISGTADTDDDDPMAKIIGRETDPGVTVENSEQYDRLQQALGTLPDEQRETILLRYFSGMSFAEIAKLTGRPLGTALARAHRGLEKLRTILSERSDDAE